MNTVIARGKRSNDSDAMSPALTQEHHQNVVDAIDDEKAPALVSKIRSITSANSLAKIVVISSDRLERQAEDVNYTTSNNSLMSPQNGKTILTVTTASGSSSENVIAHNNIDNGSSPYQTVKEIDRDINMTPRIILPCISTAGLKSISSAEGRSGIASKLAPTTADGGRSENALLNIKSALHTNGSCSSVSDVLPLQIPTVTALSNDHTSIESRASNVIRRIRHMQSILATRHTRHQMMTFVENQCKQHANKQRLDGVSSVNSLSNNSYSFSMSATTTEELNSMSTSALVDLVQRMHTANSISNIKNIEGKHKNKSALTLPRKERTRIQRAVGVTVATLNQMHVDIDSDATASSSGGETDDENVNNTTTRSPTAVLSNAHLNTHLDQTHEIKNKCCWRWTRDRAMVISRWTWLQAQVSDLEYRIRQHGEIHKQLRVAKIPVLPSPNTNQVIGEDLTQRAARCIPLLSPSCSRRHKLVRVSCASVLGQKARRPVSIRCQCVKTIRRCAICAGHHNYAKPMDIQSLPSQERVGQLDPSFHPVLSFARDVNPGIELEEIINSSDKKHTTTSRPVLDKKRLKVNKKLLAETLKKKKLALKLKKAKEKENKKKRKTSTADCSPAYLPERSSNKKKKFANKLKLKGKKKTGPRLRTKSLQNLSDDEELMEQQHAESSLAQSAPTGELSKAGPASINKRVSSYDIDDIVIPYHIACSTRVEKLQYKEIDTPRWRECTLNGRTVHEQLRRRSSSVSVPMTPLTPGLSENKLPTLDSTPAGSTELDSTPAGSTELDSTPAGSTELDSTPAGSTELDHNVETSVVTPLTIDTMCTRTGSLSSEKSSSSSLVTLEIEDMSDHRYITRHNILEAKEKSRYMNFVTSARRPRTHSTTMGAPLQKTGTPSGLLSPGNSADTSHQQGMLDPVSTNADFHTSSDHSSSIPLSSSHDAVQLKDELAVADRKRSSSFTANRPKRDNWMFVADIPHVSPWPSRSFPLVDDDIKALQCKPKHSPVSTNSWHNFDNEEWKVISTEEVPQNDKNSLVLKLSKT